MQAHRLLRGLAACTVAAMLAGCGSDQPAPNSSDRTFLQEMIPHHQRAIEIARLAETKGADPRVRAFGATVVREQTPELESMQTTAKTLGLDYTAGAADARDRVSDTELHQLDDLSGAAFDRRYIQLNISSETGAYEMAKTELSGGVSARARKIATSISYSPGQIHRLRVLLTTLG